MTTPLFCLDLSEDARDYRHTALEPGLPLLDRQGVNYAILKKWLGDYVAEPEWRSQDVAAFFLVDDARGRLEDTDCHPVSKSELQKQLAGDLDTLRAKIKKLKPESSTEQMVARILKKAIAEQTNDLENSDFDSYFFKCRAGKEDWRLVWCVGYQRADLEPLRAKLWNTPEGVFLGVRPPLQGGRARRRKKSGPLTALASPWLALALMLLIAAFLYAFWPTLKISPSEWKGPLGSRIDYRIEDHRWFFFENDVTAQALPRSMDPRVIEFEPYGTLASARSIGRAAVTFTVGNRVVIGNVEVVPPSPPDSLSIEPADDLKVAIGATRRLKAIGHYDGANDVDLTTMVSWTESEDGELLVVSGEQPGLIEGDRSGQTEIVARFPVPRDDDSYAEASATVQVVQADFVSLAVELDPETFKVGGSSRLTVRGVTADGEEHYLSSSSLLRVKVDPTTAASVDGEYLVGRAEGNGTVQVRYADLDQDLAFTIAGRAIAEDIFFVDPAEIDNAVVYELIPLNVKTGSDEPITAVSADESVVDVFATEGENAGYEVWLAARKIGSTTVTVSQGDHSQDVNVTVTDVVIDEMEFSPPLYTLRVGQPESAVLVGTTADNRTIKIVPDVLSWERQPRLENVYLDKATLLMRPLEPTELPQDLQVRLADTTLVANATVEVIGGESLTLLDWDDEGFGVHPPIPGRRYIAAGGFLGNEALLYDADLGGVVIGDVDPFSPLAEIPAGTLLTEVDGRSVLDMSADELAAYFARNPITGDSVIRYRGLDGIDGALLLGAVGVVRDLKLLDVTSANVSASQFDAEMRVYLREPGEYRLTDESGNPLSDWTAFPADATPTMIAAGIPRNADDDYELYVERRIGDRVRKFQMPFKLEAERVRPSVDVVDPTILDRDPDGTRVRERIRIRVPGSGDGTTIIRSGDGIRADLDGTQRTLISGGDTERISIRTTGDAAAPGAPGSNTRSPDGSMAPAAAPAAGAPPAGSPPPSSPSPAPGLPAPTPPSNAPPSNAPPSDAPPSPAPPASAPPGPAPPSPAPPGSPAPPQPAPPAGSDTRAPAPPGTPAPPTGSDTRAPASAYPAGSDTRFQPRTPAGTVTGKPARGVVSGAQGSTTRGKVNTPLPAPKRSADDDGESTGSGLLEALKNYRRDN